AETEILKVLDAEGVDWNLISEEIGHVARGGQSTLVVDPIDGTANALRNLPFSTVSLALGHRDLAGIEIGLVRDLHRGTTYWAVRGQGAFRDGRPIRTRTWNSRSEIFFVNLGRPATERAGRLAMKSRRIRSLGCASLEVLLVAQGSADAYFFENSPETRNLRATDVAAAYRIPLEVERRTSVFSGATRGSASGPRRRDTSEDRVGGEPPQTGGDRARPTSGRPHRRPRRGYPERRIRGRRSRARPPASRGPRPGRSHRDRGGRYIPLRPPPLGRSAASDQRGNGRGPRGGRSAPAERVRGRDRTLAEGVLLPRGADEAGRARRHDTRPGHDQRFRPALGAGGQDGTL